MVALVFLCPRSIGNPLIENASMHLEGPQNRLVQVIKVVIVRNHIGLCNHFRCSFFLEIFLCLDYTDNRGRHLS